MTRTLRVAALCVAAALWACLPAHGTTILPGISGTVFRDLDTSGKPSPGEGVSGAVLRLFLDDGDGVFQPGCGGHAGGRRRFFGCRRHVCVWRSGPDVQVFRAAACASAARGASAARDQFAVSAGNAHSVDRRLQQLSEGDCGSDDAGRHVDAQRSAGTSCGARAGPLRAIADRCGRGAVAIESLRRRSVAVRQQRGGHADVALSPGTARTFPPV